MFAAVGMALAVALAWRPLRAAARTRRLAQASQLFHRQREWLEVRFVSMASSSGKPRGLRWLDCEFDNAVSYARNRRTGQLSAFVATTISFEAIQGGPMEDVEAVGNLRAATAVFHYDGREWTTNGRVVFNLNPVEAIAYYQDHLELVGAEAGAR